jgi:hypothetical protein
MYTKSFPEELKISDQLGDISVYCKILLKWILKK